VKEPFPKVLEGLKNVYFAPVTLRPETMFGQTNCWIHPEGKYGAYQFKDSILICTERSALNLAHQGFSEEFGKIICLSEFIGQDLIGCPLDAPHSKYETVYCLPMMTVSVEKGTGIVTSVPSDSPDDYMSLLQLKQKKDLREKYKVKDEWVLPFEVVEIINIPEYGNQSAVFICEKLKIVSPNEKNKLIEAKEKVYNKGFYEGSFIIGKYKGSKVKDVKNLLTNEFIEEGVALKYSEPESLVMNRTGEECIVALTDQWFIKYGEEKWRKEVEEYTKNNIETFNPSTKNGLISTVNWLKDWACSREYGLGTKLPFDERYLIESLSDSTIYMAFYTVSHILQGGILNGDFKDGKIKPQDMDKSVWDYIFINGPFPKDSKIEESLLKKMKKEFDYWYGVDLRTSGKDLIQNHLTMFIYIHAAIFPDKKNWPKQIYANGHVLVDDEKMSKSKGNFLLIGETIKTYSCDATRIALADAGDGLDDANFKRQTANDNIIRLSNYINWVKQSLELKLRKGEKTFSDLSFENKMNQCIINAKNAYSTMHFREALKWAWFEFQKCKDDYIIDLGMNKMHEELFLKFIEHQSVIMSPITPHISQYIWELIKKEPFSKVLWPSVSVDIKIIRDHDFYKKAIHSFRVKLEKEKTKKNINPSECYIYVTGEYTKWQLEVLSVLREIVATQKSLPKDLSSFFKDKFDDMKSVMSFAYYLKESFDNYGDDELKPNISINEMKILNGSIDYISKALGIGKVKIYSVNEKDIPDPKKRACCAFIGYPEICFIE